MKKYLALLFCVVAFNCQGQLLVNPGTIGPAILIKNFFGLNSTNVNSPGLGFDNPQIVNDLELVSPSTLRFPGGTVANWWDWKTGKYIEPISPATSCYGLPLDFGSILPQNENTLENFKKALTKTNAEPIWTLNMLTSDLSSQLSMLSEASELGMPITYIELGNEFYLDNDCNIEKYPDGTTYAIDVSIWTNAIKQRFPNAKVACIGSPRITNGSDRLINWNSQLQTYFNSVSSGKPDAFTIHEYKTANLGNPSSCTDINYNSIKATCSANTIKTWNYFFARVYDHYNAINTDVYPLINPGTTALYKYWFTEYNLLDRSYFIQGSWGNTLHTTLLTMLYLQDADKIDHINCHSLIGNAVFSSIFNNTSGYDFADGTDPFCKPNAGTNATQANSLTSLGLALSEIGKAAKNAISVQRIPLPKNAGTPNLPEIKTTCNQSVPYPCLQGVKFIDASSNQQSIILNLSDQDIILTNVSNLTNGNTPTFQSFSFDLDDYITGYTTLSPGNTFKNNGATLNPVNILAPSAATSNQITLPKFSITRIYYYTNTISIIPSSNSVCEGSSLMLTADVNSEATNFQWYDQNNIPILGATGKTYYATPTTTSNQFHVNATYNSTNISSAIITIQVKTKPTLSITNGQLQNGCINNGITLSATATGGSPATYYFNWYPKSDIDDGLNSSFTANLDKSKVFTVYVSNGTCTNKSDINVTAIGEYDFSKIPDRLCNKLGGIAETFTINLPNPPTGISASYLWSDNSTSNQFIIPNASSPNYAVTVTYKNASNQVVCTIDKSFKSDIIDCCENNMPPNVRAIIDPSTTIEMFKTQIAPFSTITDIDYGYAIASPGGASNANTVVIKRTFTIDKDLKLTNFNIFLSAGAKIIVPPYRTLTLVNCKLSSCDSYLWDGIIVEEHGNIKVLSTLTGGTALNPVNISEARNAIQIKDFSYYFLSNAIFTNNLIGLKIIGSDIYINRSFGSIISNTFTSTAFLIKDGYSGMDEIFSNMPFSGIDLSYSMLSFGGKNIAPNVFSNLTAGIVALNSILNISNARFLNMNLHPDVPDILNSTGIFNSSDRGNSFSYIDESSLSFNGISSFENCNQGIYHKSGGLTAVSCNMDNMKIGINVNNVQYGDINLSGNAINASDRGIILNRNDAALSLEISENTIVMNNPLYIENPNIKSVDAGIALYEVGAAPSSRYFNVGCNNINLFNSRMGILSNAVNYPIFETNSISISAIGGMYGIYLAANHNGILHQNAVIDYNSSSNVSSRAYLLSLSSENDLVNNYSEGTTTGFDFWGDNFPINLISNRIGTHSIGLHINKSGIIGPQPVAGGSMLGNGNQWLGYVNGGAGYSSGFGAINENIGIGGVIDFFAPTYSQFLIDNPNTSTIIHPDNNMPGFPNSTNTDWFKVDQTYFPIILSSSNTCEYPPLLKIPHSYNFMDSLIVEDSIHALEFDQEMKWITSAELFERLAKDSLFRTQNEFYRDYYNNLTLYSKGKLGLVNNSIEQLYKLNSNQKNQYINLYVELKDKLNDYSDSDSILNDTSLSAYDSTLALDHEKLIAFKIAEIHQQINSLVQQNNLVLANKINYALSINETVEPTNLLELNEKHLNKFILEVLLDSQSLSNSEIEIIRNIAHQCPFSGGSSVYRARTIIASIFPDEEYNDIELCTAEGLMRRSLKINTVLTITPNPSQTIANINYSNNDDPIEKIELFNTEGIFIKTLSKTNTIPVNDLQNGMYLVKTTTNKKIVFVSKLTVIK